VTTEEPAGAIEGEFRHGEIEIVLEIPQGIPKEVVVTCKGRSGRRRIFFDRHYFIKRIARSEASFEEISQKLYQDFSIDISELLAIISGLARQTLEPDVSISGHSETREERKHYLPSKMSGISSPDSLLRDLEALLRWTNSKKSMLREDEASFSGREEELSSQPKYPSYLDQEEERTKLVIRILSNLNKIIMMSASTIKASAPAKAALNAQSVLMDFFLRIFRQTVDVGVLERLSETIDTNLSNIGSSECDKSDIARFYARLLAMSYCYNYGFPHLYLRDMLSCSEMTTERDYLEVRKFVMELIEHYYPELGFVEEEFMENYCELLTHFLSPNDIIDEVTTICNNLFHQSAPKSIDLLGKTLLAIKNCHRFALESLVVDIGQMVADISSLDPKKAAYLHQFLA
jgi:hypothetical protein